MPYLGDCRALVLLLLVLLGPALLLLSRRRWRLAAAKREEVMRLARLAAAEEEAARAEDDAILAWKREKAVVYDGGGGGIGGIAMVQKCAVCYSPTSTRCSRCKAVKYCSGKCQIIHWRQGHWEGCHPADFDSHRNRRERVSDLEEVQAERSDLFSNNLEIRGNPYGFLNTSSKKSASSVSNCSSEDFSEDDNLENRSLVDTSGTESSSDLTAVSQSSGCSTFSCPVETSDDASASGDSVHCNLNTDISLHSPKTSIAREVEPAKFPPSEFGTTCLPVHTTSTVTSLCTKSSGTVREYQDASPDSSAPQNDGGGNFTISQTCQEGYCTHSRVNHSYDGALPTGGTIQIKTRDAVALDVDGPVCVAAVKHNDAPLLKSKKFMPPSSTCHDHTSSCEGDLSVASCTSSKTGIAPTYPMRMLEGSSFSSVQIGSSESTDLKTSVRREVQKIKSSTYSRHHPSRLGSYPEKYNIKVLFPYDLFIKLYNCDKVDLRPCGLTNCGNSCYANAVLQCLAFTRPLTSYLLQGLHAKTCPKKNWCFTCEFESLLMKAKQGKPPLSPIGIISHIRDIGSNLGHGREEDAHEFLRYAIDAMQSVCLKEAGTHAVSQSIEELTLVQLTFGGYLRSKIKCMRCKGMSERHERMMDLTVEIHGDIGTLEEALVRFTTTEILDGHNKYQCNRCKSYEPAKKKLTVLEAPNVLTIALKRFQSGKFGKINKTVRFPEYLNLAPYMRGTDDKSPVYRLYAVVVHLDVMNAAFSGHYVCYVKDTQGKWYKVDDSMVKPVELERVLEQGAYMLFYARCSPRAPSQLRKTMVHDRGNTKDNSEGAVSSRHAGGSHSSKKSSSMLLHPVQHRGQEYAHQTSNGSADYGPFDLFSERLHPPKSPNTDSSSDRSSLFSCSDVGSWSTDSTKGSTGADNYSDYIFGDSGSMKWTSPQRFSDGLTALTYSPLGSSRSFEALSDVRSW